MLYPGRFILIESVKGFSGFVYVHEQQELISIQMFISFKRPKSNCFNREKHFIFLAIFFGIAYRAFMKTDGLILARL